MNGNIKRLIVDRPGDGDQEEVRHRYATVAGVLCAAVSLCTLASSLALETASALTAIGLAAFGLLLSFLCFIVPWQRVGPALIDVAPAAATLAIAIATTTIDPTYGFYLVLVAALVAYAVTRPRVLGFHLALIALALVAPVILEPEGTRKAVACALIFGPGVILVTAAAVYMRRSSEARDRAYREFATDALALASRIRSKVGPVGAGPVRAPEWLEAPAPVIPLRNVGIARVVRAPEPGRTTSTVAAQRRLPMGAIAVAASVVAAVATTTAVMRGGGDPAAAPVTAPALVREAPAAVDDRSASTARPATRRDRDRPTAATATAEPPAPASAAAAASPAAPAESSEGGGGSQPATPAPAADTQAPVPVRPQNAEPEPQTTPPTTPVQQVGPAGPVEAAAGVVEDTVGPITSELKP